MRITGLSSSSSHHLRSGGQKQFAVNVEDLDLHEGHGTDVRDAIVMADLAHVAGNADAQRPPGAPDIQWQQGVNLRRYCDPSTIQSLAENDFR